MDNSVLQTEQKRVEDPQAVNSIWPCCAAASALPLECLGAAPAAHWPPTPRGGRRSAKRSGVRGPRC